MKNYQANDTRYSTMTYRKCGTSGLKLPELSLGMWLNFGSEAQDDVCREILLTAFDNGITHFDLANNYGPPPGAAEIRFGQLFRNDLYNHRDELVISSKAGYSMWAGPYGEWGSRKHIIASCDQSLKRMSLEYVDIFYHHRPDPNTPIAETMGALAHLVSSGKALYVGISNYHPTEAIKAIQILRELGCPFVLDQVRYSMLDRWVEREALVDSIYPLGMGVICFSPLAQGLLTNKYLNGTVPEGSRPTHTQFLRKEQITPEVVNTLRQLDAIAESRGQTLSQMAISWLLKDERISSVLIGASSKEQLIENLKALENRESFNDGQLQEIDRLTLQ
ncbi:MAG: aldo/keto reductase [Sphaerochaetaceae bacterium]|jgi:L-glyceraldehyde 3-phosphate reductase|nr:aldo/keto reductase [Sphaerochaetaceae bacterium]NLO60827.1 L-glyceraldehyde 3-phosphate reductase [Spirochaetales bacterium]MDD2405924.1 aldo/keto reductase [Sphaerochaetaceae bacterium]MDD4258590.1 aldo/keto reductase [Sphaerochaetaceae bacterium]MDD4764162.1 aldo/keto reductase [Sphaerochaetaceae bacterium]